MDASNDAGDDLACNDDLSCMEFDFNESALPPDVKDELERINPGPGVEWSEDLVKIFNGVLGILLDEYAQLNGNVSDAKLSAAAEAKIRRELRLAPPSQTEFSFMTGASQASQAPTYVNQTITDLLSQGSSQWGPQHIVPPARGARATPVAVANEMTSIGRLRISRSSSSRAHSYDFSGVGGSAPSSTFPHDAAADGSSRSFTRSRPRGDGVGRGSGAGPSQKKGKK
ncbi:hypothetical protein T439DRAFT_330143 [Meredithblackwellia eburnea MCA 4105]